jgi:type I restriction enzyme M protein
VENADVAYRDSLAQEHGADEGTYSLILANPPFAGSLDYDATAKDLQKMVKTKKTELLFIALFLRLLRTGGRAAVVVPDGVLFGSSSAHKDIRKMLVEQHKLDAVIKLPSGVFRPYAGVSTAILLFTKTGVGGTGNVWFYDMWQDGLSLDDKRADLLPPELQGPTPARTLTAEEHGKNNLPDILARWGDLEGEAARPRTAQSFMVPVSDIIATGTWDLSLNRYKQVEQKQVTHDAPKDIIAELRALEAEIAEGLDRLEEMLG